MKTPETDTDSFDDHRKYFHWLTQVLSMVNEAYFARQRNDSSKNHRIILFSSPH